MPMNLTQGSQRAQSGSQKAGKSEEYLSGEFKSEIRNRIAAKERTERKERSAGVIAAGKHLGVLLHSETVEPFLCSFRSLAANFSRMRNIRNRIAAKEHTERKERSAGVMAAGKYLGALLHS